MLNSNRYQYYCYYCEKWVDFDPQNSQKSAIFGPFWTRFGPGSGPRVRVRLWTRVPGSQTRVWTLYYYYFGICKMYFFLKHYLIFSSYS